MGALYRARLNQPRIAAIVSFLLIVSFQNCSPENPSEINSGSNLQSQSNGNGSGNAASCAFAGGTIASGQSVLAYQTSSAVFAACVRETRACTNGVLSGTYTNASCQSTFQATNPVPFLPQNLTQFCTTAEGYRVPVGTTMGGYYSPDNSLGVYGPSRQVGTFYSGATCSVNGTWTLSYSLQGPPDILGAFGTDLIYIGAPQLGGFIRLRANSGQPESRALICQQGSGCRLAVQLPVPSAGGQTNPRISPGQNIAITVTNTTGVVLNNFRIDFNGSGYTVVANTCSIASFQPGAVCNITIGGNSDGYVSIATNADPGDAIPVMYGTNGGLHVTIAP